MIYLVWFTLSVVVGVFASSKGRSGFGWFVLALLISPLLAWLLVLVLAPNTAAAEALQLERGDVRKCPACAELVKIEAVKCKHCGSEIAPIVEAPAESNPVDDSWRATFGGDSSPTKTRSADSASQAIYGG